MLSWPTWMKPDRARPARSNGTASERRSICELAIEQPKVRTNAALASTPRRFAFTATPSISIDATANTSGDPVRDLAAALLAFYDYGGWPSRMSSARRVQDRKGQPGVLRNSHISLHIIDRAPFREEATRVALSGARVRFG